MAGKSWASTLTTACECICYGGAGYIGSVCVEELLDAGHEVTVYDNLTEGHRSAVDNRAVFIHARLSDTDNIQEAIRDAKAEAVVHFAANALVGESMVNPSKYFRNNVCNGLNLLDAPWPRASRSLSSVRPARPTGRPTGCR
jgi:UDP-glucose 4-epimerase